jgi:hypothetical protein
MMAISAALIFLASLQVHTAEFSILFDLSGNQSQDIRTLI